MGKKTKKRVLLREKGKNQLNILQSFENFLHLVRNYQDNVLAPNCSMVFYYYQP